MSAGDRLIPTETNPAIDTDPVIDKSLPPTPAVHPPPTGPTAAPAPPPANGDSNTNGDIPPQPKKGDKKHKSGADEKKALMERFQPPKDKKPTDLAQQKGDRWEKDPVTGGDVLLRDPKFEGQSLCNSIYHSILSNS